MRASDIDIRDAFFDEVYRIAAEDSSVMFLTADMGAFSLNRFKQDLSAQYINVGVAEQNLVSVAAGLALSGKNVFIYTIAPFVTQRCYEQIKIDLCCMRLPVTIIGVGAGITYSSDGPTHHAIQDMALMRALPEMTILNPAEPVSAAASARIAYESRTPVYVRIDKGKLPALYKDDEDFFNGLALLKKGRDLIIITTGVMVHSAFRVADKLAEHSIDAGIIDLYRIKPVNEELLLELIDQSNRIVTLEEHSIVGGIGSAVSELLVDRGKALPLKRIGIPDKNSVGYGDRGWMHAFYGLDVDNITRTILDWCQTKGGSEPASNTYSELTLGDFANLFGTDIDDIPQDCRELIAQIDFRYRVFTEEERDNVILDVLKKIETERQSVGTPERQVVWQRGWEENLRDFVESNYKLDKLAPRFIRFDEPVRLNRNYVMPLSPSFELDYFRVLRFWLFRKYLREYAHIYEFGCGTGFNLAALAQLYPEKKLHGLDFVPASLELVNKLGEVYGWNIEGHLFNMVSPDNKLKIEANSAVFTIGAIEQLASNFEPYLQYILEQSPELCIDLVPTIELYDESNLVDYLAVKLHKKRGYTENYLSRLKKLKAENKIEIMEVRRPLLGSLYMEGYMYMVWKPKQGV